MRRGDIACYHLGVIFIHISEDSKDSDTDTDSAAVDLYV